MVEVLAAFSLATDLGTGKPMGHALRACYLGMAMARELRLSTWEQAELYYSFFLMHSGCAALSLAMAPVITLRAMSWRLSVMPPCMMRQTR